MGRIEELRGILPQITIDKIGEPISEFREQFICAVNNSTGKKYKVEFVDELLDEELDRDALETILNALTELEKSLRTMLIDGAEVIGSRTDKLEYIVIILNAVSELFDLYTDMYINM